MQETINRWNKFTINLILQEENTRNAFYLVDLEISLYKIIEFQSMTLIICNEKRRNRSQFWAINEWVFYV